jgi:hypothetical protein
MPTSTQDIRRKPGRPPVESEQISVRMTNVALAQLDDWRRVQGDLPSRPEGIRRLIDAALRGTAA